MAEPSVEEVLAARRARRQQILASYTPTVAASPMATPSPGPSSAVEPTPISAVSDVTSHPHSPASFILPASALASEFTFLLSLRALKFASQVHARLLLRRLRPAWCSWSKRETKRMLR